MEHLRGEVNLQGVKEVIDSGHPGLRNRAPRLNSNKAVWGQGEEVIEAEKVVWRITRKAWP